MKAVVYVLCYDEASTAAATREFAAWPWATVVTLPETEGASRFMEGAAFLGLLPERRAEWADADFVGTLSWKAGTKIGLDRLGGVLEGVKGTADAVAFLPSADHLMRHSVRCHPRFLEIWVPLLEAMGFAAGEAVHIDIPCFFCNYWAATPAWMDRFLEFYGRATRVLESLPSVQEPLWSDSGYGTQLSIERRMQIYGTPYIPYHPFVCERLACFFFWKHEAALVLAPLGKRPFWEVCYQAEIQNVKDRAQHSQTALGWL